MRLFLVLQLLIIMLLHICLLMGKVVGAVLPQLFQIGFQLVFVILTVQSFLQRCCDLVHDAEQKFVFAVDLWNADLTIFCKLKHDRTSTYLSKK